MIKDCCIKAVIMLPVFMGYQVMKADIQVMKTDIRIDLNKIAVSNFLGFGAEWDSYGYPQNEVTDEEFQKIIFPRVQWMKLPIVRVMMQAKYVYVEDGKLNFETPHMHSLYRILNYCQKQNIVVILTEWGCEPQWLQPPGISRVEDPRYARIIGAYMDYLVNQRGYSCIEYFVLVNEPNLEVQGGEFPRWKQALLNVERENSVRAD